MEPPIEPVTLAQAKLQCKVDDDILEDDELIEELIGAARELAEDYCKRTFIETTWELTLSCFPATLWTPTAITLPMGPIIEVLRLSYLDIDAARQDIDVSTLQAALHAEPPYLLPAFGTYWPANQAQVGSILVEYRAGYPSGSPADANAVPKKAKQAIKMMVAHWYNHRADVVSETRQIPTTIPYGFERLLDSLRVYP